MNDDLKVTVTLTAEDLAFYDQAKTAGIPSLLVSMYSGALKRLVASAVEAERDACVQLVENYALQYDEPVWALKLTAAIQSRGEK